jgi:predicted transcriptional regulator
MTRAHQHRRRPLEGKIPKTLKAEPWAVSCRLGRGDSILSGHGDLLGFEFHRAMQQRALAISENLIQTHSRAKDLMAWTEMARNFLVIDPLERPEVLRGLASPIRAQILKLLRRGKGVNVNDIADALSLPQSTVSSNLQVLEDSGLIRTETQKGRKGHQKLCYSAFDEVLVMFREDMIDAAANDIVVEMPIGLYTSCEVSAPCGLCSRDGIIGFLDVPDTFLNPDRMNAALMWFTRGFVEYQFPNNARIRGNGIVSLEISMELSSEFPGTAPDWPSDITLGINGKDIGTWTSPGDFGDKRGVFTPVWWKLKGSQYGMLKTWRVTPEGTFVDGVKISVVSLRDLDLPSHHSIRLKIEVKPDAMHPGGVNIFGRGFGNYDHDIVLRLTTAR